MLLISFSPYIIKFLSRSIPVMRVNVWDKNVTSYIILSDGYIILALSCFFNLVKF